MDVEVIVKEIDFTTIAEIWREHLWPGRISPIEPVSCINVEGKIDIKIKNYPGKHFGAYAGGELVGVISCHKVSEEMMRLRGIYVFPAFQGKRIGTSLINQVKLEARREKTKVLFAMIREKNQKYFRLNGFRLYRRQEGYEFGPHVIMVAS